MELSTEGVTALLMPGASGSIVEDNFLDLDPWTENVGSAAALAV